MLRGPGIELWFEVEPEGGACFAHIRVTDGQILGKSAWLRDRIPVGTWITVKHEHQSGAAWLARYVGFERTPIYPRLGQVVEDLVLRRVA